MSRPKPIFEIDAAAQGGVYVIRMQGELDSAGSSALELALADAQRSHAERILLNLEEITFIDAWGLNAILQASRRSAGNGNRLQITRGNGRAAYMLSLTELDRMLPLTDPLVPHGA